MSWSFEEILGAVAGEAPRVVWDGTGVLMSLPVAKKIVRFDPERGTTAEFRRHTGGVTGLAVAPDGTVYGCQSPSRRIVRFNRDGTTSPLEYRLDGRLHNFPKDADVDSQGRVWFSDALDDVTSPGPNVFPLLDHASVLRLDRRPSGEWRLRRMTFDTKAPDAVLVSSDGSTLYVSENHPSVDGCRELRAYPVRDDGLGGYEVLHVFGADHRVHPGASGMCLDAEGNIVAAAGSPATGPGALLYVFAPTGRVLETVPTPARPVAVSFGDADLTALYVTTIDGSLFRVRDSGYRGFARA